MARLDPVATIARCRYCQSLAVLMGDHGRCPRGCPGYFDILTQVRVPREGVRRALRRQESILLVRRPVTARRVGRK